MTTCPHGDPSCPCQDGDALGCHYEGFDPLPCPNPPGELPHHHPPVKLADGTTLEVLPTDSHCHVEGCTWDVGTCGLSRLGLRTLLVDGEPVATPGSPWWACGASRAADVVWFALEADA